MHHGVTRKQLKRAVASIMTGDDLLPEDGETCEVCRRPKADHDDAGYSLGIKGDTQWARLNIVVTEVTEPPGPDSDLDQPNIDFRHANNPLNDDGTIKPDISVLFLERLVDLAARLALGDGVAEATIINLLRGEANAIKNPGDVAEDTSPIKHYLA
jgi:hypothetical protein